LPGALFDGHWQQKSLAVTQGASLYWVK